MLNLWTLSTVDAFSWWGGGVAVRTSDFGSLSSNPLPFPNFGNFV